MPQLLPYRLYHEDCFETFKRIKPNSVDLVLVDPPYGTTQCKWDSVIPLEAMWTSLVGLSSVAVFCSNQPFTCKLIQSNLDWFRYELIYEKQKGTDPLNAGWKPLRSHENIIVFSRVGRITYNPQFEQGEPYGKRTDKSVKAEVHRRTKPLAGDGSTGKRFPKTVLRFSNEGMNGGVQKFHPTQKPIALMEYLIKTYSNPGDTVLDFAMGSGTTGVAAMNLKRRFIGCDNDTEYGYFDTAKERIKNAYLLSLSPTL